jgi:hypothetical protein
MIIDTPDNVSMKLSALKAAGVTTIIRYLNPLGRTSKVVTPTEAHAIAINGLRMALVSEGWGDFKHGAIDAAAGKRDAISAFNYAPTVGALRGKSTIYFAVDTDATDAQIRDEIIPYFQAIQNENVIVGPFYEKWSIGIYACGAACKAVYEARLADKTWLPNALGWNGSRSYNDWNLKQHLPRRLCGVDVDINDSRGSFGDFVPFGELHTEPPPGFVQSIINKVFG